MTSETKSVSGSNKIIIVGGGPAGLTTAGALKQVGLEATILDSGARVGQSWEQRYERLHLHTVRAYSGLAHFPIPRSCPKYLSKDQYAGYLRDYAAHFDLHYVPNTLVKRVRQENNHGKDGWAVETESGVWSARVVVIATGQYGQPVQPDWSGLAGFLGETLHSAKYKSGQAYQGRRVLVVGAGNSGMEIAVDLVEQGASKVAVSIRSAPPVVPRDFLGTPAQVFGILMNAFPPAVSDRVGSALSRLALGDLRRYGLPAAQWAPFALHRTPVIDVGFADALKEGRVKVKPAVQGFTANGVVFRDETEEEYDAVVFATGFHTGLKGLLEPEGLVDGNGIPLYRSGEETGYKGLYFMGFFDSLKGFLYESNQASKELARNIKVKLYG